MLQHELIVRKTSRPGNGSLLLDVRHPLDAVTVAIDEGGAVSVTRNGRTVAIDSREALERVHASLSESDAVSDLRQLLMDALSVHELSIPELSMLAAAAFVASLAGDVDAPARLAARLVDPGATLKPVPFERPIASTSAGTDASGIRCHTEWLLRSEAAWIDYLNSLSPPAA
jgi:hypothetical protein